MFMAFHASPRHRPILLATFASLLLLGLGVAAASL